MKKGRCALSFSFKSINVCLQFYEPVFIIFTNYVFVMQKITDECEQGTYLYFDYEQVLFIIKYNFDNKMLAFGYRIYHF